jgi:hypothetical protein
LEIEMKEQTAGLESRPGQAEDGIVGYAMTSLDVPLGPEDTQVIRKLRKAAQMRLREMIDKDTVQDHG